MNRNLTSLCLAFFLFFFATVSFSQISKDKLGFGLNVGGQRLYGDRTSVGIGIGFEGLVTYRILEFADLGFALGYNQLKYKMPSSVSNTTDIINVDLKGNFEILSKGPIRPYLSLGAGLLNFHVHNSGAGRFSDAAFFGGGGLKVQLSRQINWLIGADYRFITGDNLDNISLNNEGKSNDGFLNIRTGVIYSLHKNETGKSQVIAMEKVPFYEVENEAMPDEREPNNPLNVEQETKDMEEYVRLKSRVDEITEQIDSKEEEISKLRDKLNEQKKKVASLERTAAKEPSVSIRKSSSMSGFSEIYEEALTNFYNKQHMEAISLFQLLLQQYPKHSLASNCQYWIGECYLAMNRYQESIDAFYKVLSFERSFKKDDSLFLLGKAYLKIGAGDRARESFARLIREYPNSEFIQEAKNYLGKL
ncbi:MAG: tetratricopeptide repeat protein [bacterium]